MYAGDTKKIYVDIVNGKGIPVNLTGATAIWALQYRGMEVLRKISPEQIVLTSPEVGKLAISLDSIDTKGFMGDYTHAVQIINSVGEVYTVLNGTVTMKQALIE